MWLRGALAADTLSSMAVLPESIRHVRPAQPLQFPSSQPEWDVGQSIRHLHLCAILHEILLRVLGPSSSVGCDQFVYFDAANPRRCVAPDGFVKLGVPQEMFESWKVWEMGAPELAVEVLSPSDTREPISFQEKMDRYASIGVRELVAFDVDAPLSLDQGKLRSSATRFTASTMSLAFESTGIACHLPEGSFP